MQAKEEVSAPDYMMADAILRAIHRAWKDMSGPGVVPALPVDTEPTPEPPPRPALPPGVELYARGSAIVAARAMVYMPVNRRIYLGFFPPTDAGIMRAGQVAAAARAARDRGGTDAAVRAAATREGRRDLVEEGKENVCSVQT